MFLQCCWGEHAHRGAPAPPAPRLEVSARLAEEREQRLEQLRSQRLKVEERKGEGEGCGDGWWVVGGCSWDEVDEVEGEDFRGGSGSVSW